MATGTDIVNVKAVEEVCEHMVESCPDTTTKQLTQEASAGVESNSQDNHDNVSGEADEYKYITRDDFTSEIFKICITNLPKHFGFAEFRKKLINLDRKPVKLKIVGNHKIYVTYRNEEEKQQALTTINGLVWKNRKLIAESAQPAADPLIRKRKLDQEADNGKRSRPETEGLAPEEWLKNSVMPLWKVNYEDQLKDKQEEVRMFLKRLHRTYEKTCPDIRDWLRQMRVKYGGLTCELQDIIPSPVMEGYRNKCEFTIGPGLDGKDTVGFRLGQYAKGTVAVGSPVGITFMSDAMQAVVKEFQKFVDTGEHRSFNTVNHEGHWRQLTVRTSRPSDVMLMVDFHPQQLEEAKLEEEMARLKEYFQTGPGSHCGITSCYFRSHAERMTGAPTSSPHRLVFGEETITEEMLGMKFRISPPAFFQVNTQSAELLYSKVAELCSNTPSTTVLDICCGTGTIGLSVAKSVENVIGIEMCEPAIDDAKYNASLNDISNVSYHCAKVENVIQNIIHSLGPTSDVVAIVDPPRSGLPGSVMVAIRNCPKIDRIVYVSCKVAGAMANFTDLMMPTSKRLKGERFFPVKAVPVDMFPHTSHCELVILFERWKME